MDRWLAEKHLTLSGSQSASEWHLSDCVSAEMLMCISFVRVQDISWRSISV